MLACLLALHLFVCLVLDRQAARGIVITDLTAGLITTEWDSYQYASFKVREVGWPRSVEQGRE